MRRRLIKDSQLSLSSTRAVVGSTAFSRPSPGFYRHETSDMRPDARTAALARQGASDLYGDHHLLHIITEVLELPILVFDFGIEPRSG